MPTPPSSDRCPQNRSPRQKPKEPRPLPEFASPPSSPLVRSAHSRRVHQAPKFTYQPGNTYPNPQNGRYPPLSPVQVTRNFDDGHFPPVVTKDQLYPTRQAFWKPHQQGRELPPHEKLDSHQNEGPVTKWPPSVGWQENSAPGFQTPPKVNRPSTVHFQNVQWGEPPTSPILDAVQKLRAGGDEEAVRSVEGFRKIQIESNTPTRMQSVKAELVDSSPEVGPKNENYGGGSNDGTDRSEGNLSSQEDLVDLQTALRDLAPFQGLSPKSTPRQNRTSSQVHEAAPELGTTRVSAEEVPKSESHGKEKPIIAEEAIENANTSGSPKEELTRKASTESLDDEVLLVRNENKSVDSFRTAQEDDFEFVEKPKIDHKGKNGPKSKWGFFGRRPHK